MQCLTVCLCDTALATTWACTPQPYSRGWTEWGSPSLHPRLSAQPIACLGRSCRKLQHKRAENPHRHSWDGDQGTSGSLLGCRTQQREERVRQREQAMSSAVVGHLRPLPQGGAVPGQPRIHAVPPPSMGSCHAGHSTCVTHAAQKVYFITGLCQRVELSFQAYLAFSRAGDQCDTTLQREESLWTP